MSGLRIVFMGTPDFAVSPLKALLDSGHNIVGVVTNPDKPAGRGRKIQESPVKKFAVEKGLKVLQPEKFRNEDFLAELKELNADLQVVVAFKMLPEVVWNMPRIGTINLHASLLPHYRGAAPLNWVIINGEKKTGVTTFLLKHEIDTGNIIFREEVEIGDDETVGELHDKMMETGSKLLAKTVDAIERDDYTLISQDSLLKGEESKHAPKIFKDDCKINWENNIDDIYNLIRGLSPYPAAWTIFENEAGDRLNLKIYKARKELSNSTDKTGRLLSDDKTYIKVAVEGGYIYIDELQMAGKKRMLTQDFLRGFDIKPFLG
jgi:methionyl-tRNA formyltransferase